MRKYIVAGVLLACLFMPVISHAADNNGQSQETEQQKLEREKKQAQKKPPQQNRPQQQQPNHIQPNQQQQQPNHIQPNQQQQQPNHIQPNQQQQQQQNHTQQNAREQNHQQPNGFQAQHQHPEYHPNPQNRPWNHPEHTYQQVHSRQEHFRQQWVRWREMHLNEQPEIFTLNSGDRSYALANVSPGTWYYKNESADFVVPQGYVVIAQNQEWHPGDSVDAPEFTLLTDQAYLALDQDTTP
jgi:hypothetical protein